MSDFENGLPPANTNLTDKRISDITLQTSISKDSDNQGIQSISINTEQTNLSKNSESKGIQSISINTETSSDEIIVGIKSINISSESAGKNLVMFYL